MTKDNEQSKSQSADIGRMGNFGAGATISGKVNQTINVDVGGSGRGKWYLQKDVLIPLIVGLLTAVGGAYAKHRFDLAVAPEITKAETKTLLALAKDIETLVANSGTSPDVVAKIKQLTEQARAIEATVALIGGPRGQVSQQADFWLRKNTAATLGGTTSFGVNGEHASGSLYLTVNGYPQGMPAGGRIDYKTSDGRTCFVTYATKSPEGELYGFKIECSAGDKSKKP